ncbi:unnamed protein product [Rhizophagus irregularis]|nr:unnamed protein product [Rhizophagus irregularis]
MLRPPPPPPPPPKKVSSTLESLVPSKNKTLNSRNNSSASDFQPMNSSYVDIGSGINFKRPGLKTLLERTNHGMVSVTDSAGSPSTSSSEVSRKRKASAIRARTKRKRSEVTLNRTLQVKVYPNHSQKQLLKRWMGLARFAYSSVVKWSKSDIQAGINVDKVNYKKLINSAIWGERKFLRAVQRLISKAEEKGIYVIIQNEAYTSKTCSWCGIFRRLED